MSDPNELLDDIVDLCQEVVDTDLKEEVVYNLTLAVLRDKISALRQHVAKHGYKTVEGLKPSKGAEERLERYQREHARKRSR